MNIKNVRKQINKTQEEVAKDLNLQKQTYQNYELGKREPSIDMLIKIADYFDVSLDYLCGRQNSNLIFVDSLTDTQKKLVNMIKILSDEQAIFVLGYLADMLNVPAIDIKDCKPFKNK